MEMMVTIHMILGTGTKQSSFRAKITIAAMVLEVFITYLCHRQLAWKKSRKGAVTAQNINCFTWPRKKRVALGRQSFFRTPISLQCCYLTGFLLSVETYFCIKTYAFAKSSNWILCIWLIHPKLIVLKSTESKHDVLYCWYSSFFCQPELTNYQSDSLKILNFSCYQNLISWS